MAKRGKKKGANTPQRERFHRPTALPLGWALVRLADLGMVQTENVEPAAEPNKEFELWSVPSFPSGMPEVVLGKSVGSNKQRVGEGDVLLCKINPRINRVWRVGRATGRPQIGSTEWIVFRSGAFIPDFLMWRLREATFRELLCANVSGVGGSLTRARPQDVARYEIGLPPLAEQQRITNRLGGLAERLRAVRAALAEVPKLLGQARQSLLATAFHGELTAKWRAQKAKGRQAKQKPIPDGSTTWKVPATWVQTRLDNMLDEGGLFDGPFGSKLKTKDYTPSGVRVIRLENVGHLSFEDDKQTFVSSKKHKELEKHTVGKGDIIFSSFIFEPLRVCILPPLQTKAIAKADCFCIRPNEVLVAREFLALQLASPNFGQSLKDLVHGATRPRVNTTQLRIASVAWCPSAEQNEIVRRLHAAFARLDAAAEANAQATVELDRLEQALLAKAFSGGLVSQQPADESADQLLTRIRAEREAAAKAPRPAKTKITTPIEPAMPLLDLIQKRFGKKPFTFEHLRAEAGGRPYDELKQTLFALLRPSAGADPALTVCFNDKAEAMEFTLHKP